jgi:hypothetical protein
MKTTKPTQNSTRLFKKGLKFMDFWHVTNDYLKTIDLNDKERKEIMIRVHGFSIHLHGTIAFYPIGNKNIKQKTYTTIENGLRESLRRAKISLSLNKKSGKVFGAYWLFLAKVLLEDARILKDVELENVIRNFETAAKAIQVK